MILLCICLCLFAGNEDLPCLPVRKQAGWIETAQCGKPETKGRTAVVGEKPDQQSEAEAARERGWEGR